MKIARTHMKCKECQGIYTLMLCPPLCSDCSIKLRKENEELEAEWSAFQEQETKWKNTL